MRESTEAIQHRRSKKERSAKRGERRCSRRKCSLRVPVIGVCLWRTTVRTKCRRKTRRK